jgi:hypothetical protein
MFLYIYLMKDTNQNDYTKNIYVVLRIRLLYQHNSEIDLTSYKIYREEMNIRRNFIGHFKIRDLPETYTRIFF